jgi:hypothetical protein
MLKIYYFVLISLVIIIFSLIFVLWFLIMNEINFAEFSLLRCEK